MEIYCADCLGNKIVTEKSEYDLDKDLSINSGFILMHALKLLHNDEVF